MALFRSRRRQAGPGLALVPVRHRAMPVAERADVAKAARVGVLPSVAVPALGIGARAVRFRLQALILGIATADVVDRLARIDVGLRVRPDIEWPGDRRHLEHHVRNEIEAARSRHRAGDFTLGIASEIMPGLLRGWRALRR